MHNNLKTAAIVHLAEMIKENVHIVEIKYVSTLQIISSGELYQRETT